MGKQHPGHDRRRHDLGFCHDAVFGPDRQFCHDHPSIKVLALSFLLMIGVMLVAEGFGTHFNKNYVYFAIGVFARCRADKPASQQETNAVARSETIGWKASHKPVGANTNLNDRHVFRAGRETTCFLPGRRRQDSIDQSVG